MNVVWTADAEQDRLAIWEYLTERNPAAALRMDQLFGSATARLADFPRMGRPGEIVGTREITPHPNYRIVYEIDGDTVLILVLIHTARLWPPRSA